MKRQILILRDDLDEDPRVRRMASIFSAETDLIVGKLYRLWRFAIREGKGGFLAGFAPAGIDNLTGIVGFGHALVSVGWLEERPGGLQIPRWDEWCGPAAMARILASEIQKRPLVGFDEFWAAYPRKEGKVAARKAWGRLRPEGDFLKAILHGLARWCASGQWRRGIIPHAATWLNNWRWEDEIHDEGDQGLGRGGRVGAPEGKYARLREGGAQVPPGR